MVTRRCVSIRADGRGNLYLCLPCFANENMRRYRRAKETGRDEDCPQVSWSTAEVAYDKHGEPFNGPTVGLIAAVLCAATPALADDGWDTHDITPFHGGGPPVTPPYAYTDAEIKDAT